MGSLTKLFKANLVPCRKAPDLVPESKASPAAVSRRRAYPKGSRLFVEGQAADGIHVLLEGKVQLSISSKEGKRLVTRIARPGEVLGLSSVISSQPREVTAEAVIPSQSCFIKQEDFLRLLRQRCELGFRIVELLSCQVCEAVELARILSGSRA